MEGWCRDNNLYINMEKTKEIVMDYRRIRSSPLSVRGADVVSSFKCLGVHITDVLLMWSNTYCLVKKAHQRLFFLRTLRQAGLNISVLVAFCMKDLTHPAHCLFAPFPSGKRLCPITNLSSTS